MISTRISGYRSRYIIIRPCARYISENTHAEIQSAKDHVRPVSKRLCIIFMACSCPIFVLGRLIKEEEETEEEEEEDGENRGFSVFGI